MRILAFIGIVHGLFLIGGHSVHGAAPVVSVTETINAMGGAGGFQIGGVGTNYDFQGNNLTVGGFTDSNGDSYVVAATSDMEFIRTNSTSSDQNSYWYERTGVGGGTITHDGPLPANAYSDFMSSNSIHYGTDNTFTNGTLRDDEGNIERLDYVFSSGFTFDQDSAIAIFERGAASGHDGFRVALVGSIDMMGNPLTIVGSEFVQGNNWSSDVSGSIDYSIFRSSPHDSTATSDVYAAQAGGGQVVGGMVMRLGDFGLTSAQTIYGYMVYADDYGYDDGNAPTDPTEDTSQGSGIDLVSVNGVVFRVPEPSVTMLVMFSCMSLLQRRRV